MGEKVVFRLLDRKPTDSKEIGNEGKPLDFAEWYAIKNPFFVREKGGTKVNYRYIQGSQFLKVEEQVKAGEIFNPMTDVLGFSSGDDIIVDEEFDSVRIKILQMHPWNPKSPYHQSGINPAIFGEWSANEEAKAELAMIDSEDEAMAILGALRKNTDRLKVVGLIFGISSALSDEQIYLSLRAQVKENPENYVKKIGDKRNSFLATIRKAFDLNVVALDAKGYIFTDERGLIFEPTGKKSIEKEQSLVDFLMSEEGKDMYDQINVSIAHAEVDLSKAK